MSMRPYPSLGRTMSRSRRSGICRDRIHRIGSVRTLLHQLQRQPVDLLDKRGAGLAERIGAFDDGNAGRLQVREHGVGVEVGVGDPVVFAGAAVTLTIVGLPAGSVPAYRASRLSPSRALTVTT